MLSLSDEDLAAVTIQDIALCQVWCANGGAGREPPAGLQGLSARVQRWLAHRNRPEMKSEGRRSQTLLRELIDRIEAGDVERMTRDELDLLEAVHGLAQAVTDPEMYERVRRAIAPRRARIAVRRASMLPVTGTPALTARFLVLRTSDIQAAPPREIKVMAGVEMPFRGPVLAHCGHVRVLGDVPQDCTLVVEEGAVVIDGYVLGRVAVSGNCEVLQNISGVAISRNGDVRARNIVDSAFVVAKRGMVHFRRAAGVRMIFAGNMIRAAERCSRSRLFAPTIVIGEAAEASEIHVSRRVEAAIFRGLADTPLNIVFRRNLSCCDYGENPGKTMAIDVTRALRSRSELERVRQQMRIAVQEAEGAAETALTYALAGEVAAQVAGEVLAAQRRLDVINRVLIGLRAMYAEAETAVDASAIDESAQPDQSGASGFLDSLDSEISQLMSEQPGDATLKTSYDEIVQTRQKVRKSAGNHGLLRVALADIGGKLARWRDEFIKLDAEVRDGRDRIRAAIPPDLLEEMGGGRSRVLALQRLVQRASKGGDASLQKRLDTPLTQVLQRTIEKRLALSRKLKEDTAWLQKQFNEARDVVWTKFQMRIESDGESEHRIVVEGSFEAGIRLLADASYLKASASEIPHGGECMPGHTKGERARYVFAGGHIGVETIAAPAESELAAV